MCQKLWLPPKVFVFFSERRSYLYFKSIVKFFLLNTFESFIEFCQEEIQKNHSVELSTHLNQLLVISQFSLRLKNYYFKLFNVRSVDETVQDLAVLIEELKLLSFFTGVVFHKKFLISLQRQKKYFESNRLTRLRPADFTLLCVESFKCVKNYPNRSRLTESLIKNKIEILEGGCFLIDGQNSCGTSSLTFLPKV